jgi:hypothetical protein
LALELVKGRNHVYTLDHAHSFAALHGPTRGILADFWGF